MDIKTHYSFDLKIPTRLKFGVGRLNELGEEVRLMGKHALLVTMPELEDIGHVGKAVDILKKAGVNYTIWNQVREDPRAEDADARVKSSKLMAAIVLSHLAAVVLSMKPKEYRWLPLPVLKHGIMSIRLPKKMCQKPCL
jgi:hypothetical protein